MACEGSTCFRKRTERLVSWVELPEAVMTSARYNTQQDKHQVQTSAFLRKRLVQEWHECNEASEMLPYRFYVGNFVQFLSRLQQMLPSGCNSNTCKLLFSGKILTRSLCIRAFPFNSPVALCGPYRISPKGVWELTFSRQCCCSELLRRVDGDSTSFPETSVSTNESERRQNHEQHL